MTRKTCGAARAIKCYGWIPDLPDHRDFIYAAPPAVLRALPPKNDLTGECPPVYDQGELGSCTANAIGGAHEFEQRKQNARRHSRRPGCSSTTTSGPSKARSTRIPGP